MMSCVKQKRKELCNQSSQCGWMSIQNERQRYLRKRGFDAFLSSRLKEEELTPSPPLSLSPRGCCVYINPARLRQSSTTTLCGCT